MVRLRLKPDLAQAERAQSVRDDVNRWVLALQARGFEVSDEVIYAAWQRYSEASCAGWLASYGNDERDCTALLAELEPDATS